MTDHKAPLPDAADREAIVNDIDTNIVVEAAAGTGKTTCLVGRLMTLFRRGALAGESRLAAVTFTHKAAAELRERLDRELSAALAETEKTDSEERRNLAAAAAALPECHIGTIHSFCARLLRERPVEAGVGPDFRELDEEEDLPLRRQAWEEFAAELHGGRHPELYSVFETFGLDQEALAQGFEKYADFPDVDSWPGVDVRLEDVDVAGFIDGVRRYNRFVGKHRPALDSLNPGNDKLIPILQRLNRRLARLPNNPGPADAFRLAGLFKEKAGIVQKQWKPLGLDGDGAKEEKTAYERFYRETVKPFLDSCLAVVYGASFASFAKAETAYSRLRREKGLLNFQDLLMLTARLLRDHPGVRADLSRQYARLLVDEVQDTDPVQAEIMFLLAAADRTGRDWRRCRLRPGALFIVGDPKQSIYRFRRADIAVYQEVKKLIAEQGGRLLGLVANFRSQPSVIDWVNDMFFSPDAGVESGRFSDKDSEHSPAYIHLRPGLPPAPPECFQGVFRLETIPVKKAENIHKAAIVRDEAARIASFIRHAVDGGVELPGRNGPRPATPADFMIVTYRKGPASVYAEAVRRLGLPCLVSSGGTLADSPALKLLADYLKALTRPDDPILLAAVLRGGLFGVADTVLYRWKKAGGKFCFLAQPPETDSRIREIFAAMARHHGELTRQEPVLATERIVDDLGLWPFACLGDDPATGAGVVAAALSRLATERNGIATPGKLVDRLDWLLANYEKDPLPAKEQNADAVRIMNVHKTKGLEAPVVFLTSTLRLVERQSRFAVRRGDSQARGYMAITGGGRFPKVIGQPRDWGEIGEEEGRFLSAEKTRLNYVAATRAGSALVVSLHKTDSIWKSAFLPPFGPEPELPPKLPEPEAAPAAHLEALERLDEKDLATAQAERGRKRPRMLAESYRTTRAKPDNDWLPGEGATNEAALDLGQVVHTLLAENPAAGLAAARTAELLREYDLPMERAEDIAAMVEKLRASGLWKRAETAEVRLRETPFSLRLEDGSLQRGIIDLAFREKSGWVVVDYKSDRPSSGTNPVKAAARHSGQLAAYADAWEKIVGEKVTESGVFFLRTGDYVPLWNGGTTGGQLAFSFSYD